MLSGQGEARPERILRRFFTAFVEMWQVIHQQNQHFLPKDKKFKLFGDVERGKDAYQEVTQRDMISGNFNFTFAANVFNTSKEALQQSLGLMLQTYVSEINVQLGIIQPDGIYRLERDYGKAYGVDVNKYLSQPSAEANANRILAEEAIATMIRSEEPDGLPLEPGGAVEHMQKLIQFAQSDNFGLLTETGVQIFAQYLERMKQLIQREQQQQQLQQAAGAFNSNQEQGAVGRPGEAGPPDTDNPQVSSGGELIDEALPGAGGGGNVG